MEWTEIVFWIFQLVIAYCAGILSSIWFFKNDYYKAVDDAYEVGYLKGKEEAEEQND